MLYKKHLTSLEDLQAERAAIKKNAKKKALALKKPEKTKDKGGDPLQKGISFLTGSLGSNSKLGPVLEMAAQFGLPILLKKGAQMGVRRIAMTALKEVTFGYVKWKAISIAASIISKKIKQRKERIQKEAK